MIDKDKLDKTILELETHDTTYATCERLAWLYIVRDHVNGSSVAQPQPINTSGKSEFLRAIDGRNSVDVWNVIDELMDTLMVVNRRAYDGVMRKITSIPNNTH